ncbi:MAG: DUF3365 domain-containing protein [Alcanivoracaceae bacterium]|nr:DUF3365 domain-containing protein [Alcanivoracaceae bacterium]
MLVSRCVMMFLAVALLAACSEPPQSASPALPEKAGPEPEQNEPGYDPVAVKQLGAASLLPFKQQLMQALQRGMQQGAENAIDVCRLQAPAIAASVSGNGIEVGRSSHRLRNPANAPTDWQQQALDHYLAGEDRDSMVIDLGGDRVGYVEPIVAVPMCLACHGSELSAPVTQALSAHYPDDQATGFAAGDLRGIFWVSLPLAQASAGNGE